jgi:hypothetical protein
VTPMPQRLREWLHLDRPIVVDDDVHKLAQDVEELKTTTEQQEQRLDVQEERLTVVEARIGVQDPDWWHNRRVG